MKLVIDSAKFTREKEQLHGTLPIASLGRLTQSVHSHAGEMQYAIQGGIDEWSRPTLHLVLRGELALLCQRCLMPMPFTVSVDTTLVLFASEEAIDIAQSDDPEIEGILFDDSLDAVALVREELILALPYAPVHQQCGIDGMVKSEKLNPFAVLATLKQK